MPRKPLSSLIDNERGQMVAGYIVAIMLIAVVMVTVIKQISRTRTMTDQRIYQDQAMALARQGFEEGLSFFRRQASGVYLLDGVEHPLDQRWTTPWPMYPDAAFVPQSKDTDHFNAISFVANVNMTSPQNAILSQVKGARAIIRTFPLMTVATSGTAEVYVSPTWGRYVIRRQNYRNWSPGPNTFSAFTDPEAAHDLTHQRSIGITPGAGNYWSLVARSYVLANPTGTTLNSYYENQAMFEGSDLVSAPKAFYLNKRFRMATARVYGELYRINFNNPQSGSWVTNQTNLSITTNALMLGGSDGTGIGIAVGTVGAPTGTSGYVNGGVSAYGRINSVPSVANAFPGLDQSKLMGLADVTGTADAILLKSSDPDLTEFASTTAFYYVTGPTTFLAGSNTAMTGAGLIFINGDVTFNKGNYSTWSGIVFVKGNCTIHASASILGTLIVTGNLNVGNRGGVDDNSKSTVQYDSGVVQGVMDYLQRFRVDKNSILATFN